MANPIQPVCLRVLCASLAWLPSLTMAQPEDVRVWTDVQNRQVTATFGGMQQNDVLLKLPDGKTVPFPLDRLSAADQAFVKSRNGGASMPAAATTSPMGTPPESALAPANVPPSPPRVPIEKRTWPENVEVPSRAIEIEVVTEDPAARKYVYRSESFEFSSQAKLAGSVMKEVARTFEATRALVRALPWGIACEPPTGMERFQAALYETRSDYTDAGGPAMSGGVYSSGDKTFKIPFPSLGLEKRGQTYFKQDFVSDTLVHEITHQMMDEYLTFLPMWMIEGSAEYTEMLPYKAGVFRADAHKNGIKDVIDKWGGTISLDMLKAHMTMTRSQWAQNSSTQEQMADLYRRSHLLVYFFCHLDGDKKGTRLLKFFEAVHGEVAALRAFFADPRVKRFPGGRFSYPAELTPPDMESDTAPFKHLALLQDERSYEKLAAEITEGYKSIGVKVQVR